MTKDSERFSPWLDRSWRTTGPNLWHTSASGYVKVKTSGDTCEGVTVYSVSVDTTSLKTNFCLVIWLCLLCSHVSSYVYISYCSHVCMWHTPISSWETRKLRPSLSHKGFWLKNEHVHETIKARGCLQWPRTVFMSRVHIFSWVHTHWQESQWDRRDLEICYSTPC